MVGQDRYRQRELAVVHLKEAQIDFVGAGETASQAYQFLIKEVNGIKFAFLAYSYTGSTSSLVALMDTEKMKEAVKEASEKADFVIVSMHDGVEYQFTPNSHQVNFAHQAIDAGADLIIGHHPHVVQAVEEYNGAYIIYSLGNFIFDQMWSQKTREGLIAKVVFEKKGLSSLDFYPVIIEDYSQARFAEKEEGESILERLDLILDERSFSFREEETEKEGSLKGIDLMPL